MYDRKGVSPNHCLISNCEVKVSVAIINNIFPVNASNS